MDIQTEQEEPEFQPITFKITVETEEELNYLWSRFNVNENSVKRSSNGKKLPEKTPQMKLFMAVDDILKQLKNK